MAGIGTIKLFTLELFICDLPRSMVFVRYTIALKIVNLHFQYVLDKIRPVVVPRGRGGRGAEDVCVREVLLPQSLHQHGPELRVNAPKRAFPIGLKETEGRSQNCQNQA